MAFYLIGENNSTFVGTGPNVYSAWGDVSASLSVITENDETKRVFRPEFLVDLIDDVVFRIVGICRSDDERDRRRPKT